MLLGDISLVGQLEKDVVLMAQENAVKGLEAMKLLLGYCAILDIKDKVSKSDHILTICGMCNKASYYPSHKPCVKL